MKVVSPYALYEMLQRPGRLIGMDVGSRYVGLVVSDLQYKFAAPYGVIERSPKNPHKNHQMALKIQKLVTNLSGSAFIIGYPFQSGKIEPSLKHMPDFIQELIWSGMFKDMPYTLWDESFTTKGYVDGVNRHEKYLLELAMSKELENEQGESDPFHSFGLD